MWRELPADTRVEDLPDNARWAVDPREPGVQESGPYIVPVPHQLSAAEIRAINDEDGRWARVDAEQG